MSTKMLPFCVTEVRKMTVWNLRFFVRLIECLLGIGWTKSRLVDVRISFEFVTAEILFLWTFECEWKFVWTLHGCARWLLEIFKGWVVRWMWLNIFFFFLFFLLKIRRTKLRSKNIRITFDFIKEEISFLRIFEREWKTLQKPDRSQCPRFRMFLEIYTVWLNQVS